MSTENFHMMMSEGIVPGHFISAGGIQVDPAKIKVISATFLLLECRKRYVVFLDMMDTIDDL